MDLTISMARWSPKADSSHPVIRPFPFKRSRKDLEHFSSTGMVRCTDWEVRGDQEENKILSSRSTRPVEVLKNSVRSLGVKTRTDVAVPSPLIFRKRSPHLKSSA